jgi:hypothetical protein
MIVGDERDQPDNLKFDVMGPLVNLKHASVYKFKDIFDTHRQIRSWVVYRQL